MSLNLLFFVTGTVTVTLSTILHKMAMPPPPPKGPLERYRLLSPNASLRVSPLCLGAMNFGNAWSGHMGACDQKTTESILDYFYEQGGTLVDTTKLPFWVLNLV